MQRLETLQQDTASDPGTLVVWLHGLGADGHDFEPIIPQLNGALGGSVRWVFPHAPRQPVTINGGLVMRAWFDIAQPELDASVDITGIQRSIGQVRQLMEQQWAQGFTPEHTILAGFSQGGLIALGVGLAEPQLAGIVALSTFFPPAMALPTEPNYPPVFLAHGEQDPVIPMALAGATQERLRAVGAEVEFRRYPIPHSVSADEIADLAAWLGTVLPAGSS